MIDIKWCIARAHQKTTATEFEEEAREEINLELPEYTQEIEASLRPNFVEQTIHDQ